jgi:DMSO/TMAO reductase YedYZ molybdopterin-dependent catalytic subunit
MPLFVVRHQHTPESCPASDFQMGAMLLNHLSKPSVRRHGIQVHGEAVVGGEHTLYMIVDSPDLESVQKFMQPFGMVGTVDIYPSQSCVHVVASGGCGLALPVSDEVPALDPEEACERAMEAGLVVHRAHPLNGETSIPALVGGVVMPNAHFYVRNHFQIPDLDPATWQLHVDGQVERPLSLSLREIQRLPSQTLTVTLECAGNGRALLDPPVDGEKWQWGAVSTAEWTGVSLAEVLDRAGVKGNAQEVVFRGADGGTVDGRPGPVRFERSLQIDQARDRDILLAYAMNGEALPVQHGFPLRLIVPGWYGVAAVKWLTDIEVVDRPFDGFFQVDRYFFEREQEGQISREPLTLQRVRALITEPDPGERLERGDLVVRGVAWSGAAPIARVEVSLGGGPWQEARLIGQRPRHGWQWWELQTRAEQPGPLAIRARATDLASRTQPEQPEWNRLGYANNAIQEISISIV